MATTLTIYDQRPGALRKLYAQLELPTERLTARELIRRRVEADLSAAHADQLARRLVRPGTTETALNGAGVAYTATDLDIGAAVETALRAFERNGFFMIFDGRQVTDLDETLTIERDSALTFIRLVPLVGG